MNTAYALHLPETRAMSWFSSPTLARVQGQCGCANNTSVGWVGSSGIRLCAGHCEGASPETPGTLAAWRIAIIAPTTTHSQNAAAMTVSTDGPRGAEWF